MTVCKFAVIGYFQNIKTPKCRKQNFGYEQFKKSISNIIKNPVNIRSHFRIHAWNSFQSTYSSTETHYSN